MGFLISIQFVYLQGRDKSRDGCKSRFQMVSCYVNVIFITLFFSSALFSFNNDIGG